MADRTLTAPVGRRWRNVNVTNTTKDQRTIIELLSAIPPYEGGKQGAWTSPVPASDGVCPKELEDAIWDFQIHWKSAGVFNVIDGVVDPGKNTLRKLNELAQEAEIGPYGLPWPPLPPLKFPRPGPIGRTLLTRFVSTTHEGSPHDHDDDRLCPLIKNIPGDPTDPGDGRVTHIATPINPTRAGRMVNIGGMRETKYLGFEDFVPDPSRDPSMPANQVHGRRLTTSLPDGSVSDICFRSTPLDSWMRAVELPRLCAVGCRLTYAASSYSTHKRLTAYYYPTLGPTLEYVPVLDTTRGVNTVYHVTVVTMVFHRR